MATIRRTHSPGLSGTSTVLHPRQRAGRELRWQRSRVSPLISILKGGIDTDYRIIEKSAFDAVGKARKISLVGGENFRAVPQFWDEFIHDKNGEKVLMEYAKEPGPVTGSIELGICVGEGVKNGWWESPKLSAGYEGFIYAIGVEKPDKPVPKGFEVFHIPKATWVVFESVGPMPKSIQDVTVKIFQEWFPSTGYEHDAKPELEVYLPGDPNSKDYRCQVWIPILKKKKTASTKKSQ